MGSASFARPAPQTPTFRNLNKQIKAVDITVTMLWPRSHAARYSHVKGTIHEPGQQPWYQPGYTDWAPTHGSSDLKVNGSHKTPVHSGDPPPRALLPISHPHLPQANLARRSPLWNPSCSLLTWFVSTGGACSRRVRLSVRAGGSFAKHST